MTSAPLRLVTALAACVLLAACATKPQTTAGLTDQMPLAPAANDVTGGTLVYRAPNVDADLHKFRGLYVAPAALYEGADAEWGSADLAMRQRVAAQLTTELRRALRAAGVHVLTAPAPGGVTLQMTLAGITDTHGVAANVIKLTPVGLGLTLVKSAAGLPATFTGSITVAGKVTATDGGALLGGFVSRLSPTALDPRTLSGTEETAMLAATKAADNFADAVIRMRKGQ